MSSRGRRSAGENAPGLNTAMIHLLDMSRLRKELESRGLDTKGNKTVLADRLKEAIFAQKNSSANASLNTSIPSVEVAEVATTPLKRSLSGKAQPEKTSSNLSTPSAIEKSISKKSPKKTDKSNKLPPNRTRKRKTSEVDNAFSSEVTPNEENSDCMSVPEKKVPPFKLVWAAEAPIKELKKIQHASTTRGTISTTTNVTNLTEPTPISLSIPTSLPSPLSAIPPSPLSATLPSPSPSPGRTSTKKKVVPPRAAAGGIDLLDTIFLKQDQLLADKYKSEQEKAAEKQMLELQKRKMSRDSIVPLEKPLHKSIVHNKTKSLDSCEEESFVGSPNDRDPLNLRNFDPRDPLNLRNVESVEKVVLPPPPPPRKIAKIEESMPSTSPDNSPTLRLSPPPPPPMRLPLPPPPPPPRPKIVTAFCLPPPPPPKEKMNIETACSETNTDIGITEATLQNSSPMSAQKSPEPSKSPVVEHVFTNESECVVPTISLTADTEIADNTGPVETRSITPTSVSEIMDISTAPDITVTESSCPLEYNPQLNFAPSPVPDIADSSSAPKSIEYSPTAVAPDDSTVLETTLNEEKLSPTPSTTPEATSSENTYIPVESVPASEVINEPTSNDPQSSSSNREEDELSILLKDPKALLQRASDVLKRINESELENQEASIQYDQIELDTTDYVMEEVEKPLPDFHGEPVPEDEDDEDALFEIAAGLRPAKKKDLVPIIEDEPLPDDEFIELDYYNADMNIKASTNNKWLIDPDNQDGFALMWGGVKSNYGILAVNSNGLACGTKNDDEYSQGTSNERVLVHATVQIPKRIAFQIKIVEFLSLKHVPFEELEPHDVRIGWSTAGTSNMLGESNHSYMFCSNARKAASNVFVDYGDPFHINDVITTILDFEKQEIRYYKNRISLGVAFSNFNFPAGTVVFPHIATKNCKVLVNFGVDNLPEEENPEDWKLPEIDDDEEDGELKEYDSDTEDGETDAATRRKWASNDLVLVGELKHRSGLLVPSRRPPPDKAHCTVIVMVGLPGAGKTSWVKQYLRDHAEEHWILFNTDSILSAMTVNGVPRRRVYQGRWDMVMGLTAKALNRSLQMACRRRHNYILDQTNVSRDARRKKLTQFVDFQRKCVVLIPSDDELERRLLKQARQEGSAGQIPVEAMLELKGAFSIPCVESEPIEDVLFVEPPISRINEAIELVAKYNEEGRPWIRKNHTTQKPEPIISDSRDTPNLWLNKK